MHSQVLSDVPTQPVVEFGGNWVHGADSNYVLWPTVQALGLEGSVTNYSDLPGEDVRQRAISMIDVHHGVRNEVPKNVSDFWQARFDDARDACTEIALSWKAPHSSVTDCLEHVGFWEGVAPGSLDERVAEYFSWELIDFEDTVPPSELLNNGCFPENYNMSVNDYLVMDRRGYAATLDDTVHGMGADLIRDGRVLLDQFVQSVTKTGGTDEEDDRTSGRYNKGTARAADGREQHIFNEIVVTTNDGTDHFASRVLVTVPLGILKASVTGTASVLQFLPALLPSKVAAVTAMGFGHYGKLWLTFPDRFWDDSEIFKVASDQADESVGAAPWALNLDLPKYLPGSRTLNLHIAGSACRAVETAGADSLFTRKFVANAVRRLFGEDIERRYQNSTLVTVTNWTVSSNFRGSYSYWPLGLDNVTWAALKEPEWGGALHFAGEHTSLEHFGFVHGAVESGRRAANEILETLPTN